MNVNLTANQGLSLNEECVILDSASMVTTVTNPNFVHKYCTAQVGMRVYINRVYTDYSDISILNRFPLQTYVKPSSMSKILSLAVVASAYDVSMNTKVDTAMYVHAQGKIIILINFRPESTTLILKTSIPTSRPILYSAPKIFPCVFKQIFHCSKSGSQRD